MGEPLLLSLEGAIKSVSPGAAAVTAVCKLLYIAGLSGSLLTVICAE
jgi:hypothetical protein